MTTATHDATANGTGVVRPFAHLHCHTHYSLLDGANKIPDLIKQVDKLGMNACAITDHGNLYGALEFYLTCRKHDINPILGYEAYIAPGSRLDKAGRQKDSNFHLTLLAQNGPMRVTDIHARFAMSLNAVSKHIKVLEQAGLVTQGRRAQYRPCTLNVEPLRAVASWTDQYRPIWEARFDRMDSYLRDLRTNAPKTQGPSHD